MLFECKYCHSNHPSYLCSGPQPEPIPDYGDLYTLKDFYDSVRAGHFIDYDGSGHYSDGVSMFRGRPAKPSELYKHGIYNISYTHVVWFNK